ncbi:sugar ABC transporter ATP-binding protein [Halorubrum sp. E3]|uniref:ABC-type D-xylose/L-arabinose transporter n=1 Tax=Halorubrum persicum TaxID=1383844 RepID=A0A2G1WMF7_9EURY|nr:ABC transporter ATP-binding protein [Halorubrum persicum]OYR95901.1 sugar ABC transporter ATP-binding protein [Halorubrum sp. E3]PHQ40157.1 sugar ABC transporter ATP-binding protein [Halorubrum persicum]
MKVELTDLTKKFDDLVAVNGVSLTVKDGEFLTLVGPSGCGKSTILRCVTGLEVPTSGRILFDGKDVTDQQPQERGIAMVFQNYALYPHMTARRNMSFALEDESLSKAEIESRISETAEMLGIGDHLDQIPEELSGGQKQRVALGRSLVRNPDIILMDEPLSNLDAKLRIELRAELQKIHQELETTTVYVTHDQEEAMTMSDRIVVLNDGEIQQVSSPEAAYNRPENRFVADFIGSPGMNFMRCRLQGGTIRAGPFSFDLPDAAEGKPTEIGIRPEDISLAEREGGDGTVGEVNVFEHIGPYNIVYLDVEDIGEIVAQIPASQYFDIGQSVSISVRNDRIHLFNETGRTIYNPPLPSDADVETTATSR